MLLGWGAFDAVEGVVDHRRLVLHHVNETVPPEQTLLWDLAFLVWGAAMLISGWLMVRVARRAVIEAASTLPGGAPGVVDRTRHAV
jgi:uncharacterized membrane protein